MILVKGRSLAANDDHLFVYTSSFLVYVYGRGCSRSGNV
jgi:hypothetical protein